jgi:translation initiation factor IF-2
MTSKDLMAFLRTQGHVVKSHMASIEDNVAQILRDRMKPKLPPAPRERDEHAAAASGARGMRDSAVARRPVPGQRETRPPQRGWQPPLANAPAAARVDEPERGSRSVSGVRGPGTDRPAERGSRDADKTSKGQKRVRFFPTHDQIYQDQLRTGAGLKRLRARPASQRAPASEQVATVPIQRPEKIEVAPPVTVKDLSAALGVKAPVILKTLFQLKKPVSINQYLDDETLLELGVELGTEILVKKREESLDSVMEAMAKVEDRAEDLQSRAPVVTFLGHVDHGKTSLLDRIRQTNVTQSEYGGITQHLGAYRVDKGDIHITFIDTPGHEAFTQMRARGANVTDIAVLVVAADDGPMPQTEEALSHARAAEVPIVVALNKVDKPTANPQRCKDALSKLGLLPVEWNGSTEFVEVSALTGQGIDNLLETLSLEAQILELKANPSRPGVATVLDAESNTRRGVIATVLVQDGTVRVGDYVLCGSSHGRIRGMLLNGSRPLDSATPSMPVQIMGLSKVPQAGEKLYVFTDERLAKQLAEEKENRERDAERKERPQQQATLEDLFRQLKKGSTQELRLVVKTDVRGSIEALRASLESLSTEEVKVVLLHTGVGTINQADVHLAHASDAVILGFHVAVDDQARLLAEERKVEIRLFRIIYEVVEAVKSAMEAKLAPEKSEEVHGHLDVRQVFKASRIGSIAGCMVSDGLVKRSDRVRVLRGGKSVHQGEIGSLRRLKDDVREVKEGFECGMKVANFDDIQVGDVIEAYAIVEKPRSL